MAMVGFFDRVRETSTTAGTGDQTLAGPERGFRSFSSTVGNGNSCYYAIVHQTASEWEVGIGTYTSSTNTLSRDTILASSNSGSAVNFSSGNKDVFLTAPGEVLEPMTDVGGRLTLTSGEPGGYTDVTAGTTVYYTPYTHAIIALPRGAGLQRLVFSEVSVSVPATTNTPFDVFGYYNSGSLALETVNWTNTTTRATALARHSRYGFWVKSGDESRRYLGTGCTTGTSGKVANTKAYRGLWNMYNRLPRPLGVVDTTNNWTYTTDTYRQANANTANRVEVVCGLAEVNVNVAVGVVATNSTGGVVPVVGIGVDTTSANNASVYLVGGEIAVLIALYAYYRGFPGAGYHALNWVERSPASGTTTWYGDNGGVYYQSGMWGDLLG